jgi:hypothetical protein
MFDAQMMTVFVDLLSSENSEYFKVTVKQEHKV